ncbi:MAG: hypothetical protein RO469_16995 [Thermincola sp.]|nr:hypothetical protein [Thermincola sp.]MDT3702791.1 hypothetical protein [Thermincola sp.]
MGKKKRETDIWNEKADNFRNFIEAKADQYADQVARNKEGISADFEKYPLDETTTPKVFHPNKNE